jgi:cell division septation protein DedD
VAQQDDYYYEIQLTNKQLVFYFMAGATGLILSFLAGVMVGRGVDSAADAAGGRPTPVQEERMVAEESPRPEAGTPELNYARRLEGERRDDGLERPAAATPAPPPTPTPRPAATPTSRPVASPTPEARRAPPSTPAPRATPAPTPVARAAAPRPTTAPGAASRAVAPGTFSIQVGAFKERRAAESVAARLKGKGFPTYVVTPDGAPNELFNVRVGTYTARADAELVQARLRDQEKFKPFIVRN